MIVPLAEAMYDKLYAESEEEIVYNLVGLLHIKDKFNEDGVCVGGSGDYEQYSWLSDMVYGIPTQLHETVQKTNTVKWHSKHLSTGTPATSAASYLFLCFVTSK